MRKIERVRREYVRKKERDREEGTRMGGETSGFLEEIKRGTRLNAAQHLCNRSLVSKKISVAATSVAESGTHLFT